MKFKTIAIALMTCSLVLLTACSSTKRHDQAGSSAGMDASGVQASGMSRGAGFGDDDGSGSSSSQAARERVYYFDYDRSEVHESDRPAIFANADYLVAHPNAKVIVEGHTDPRGSREYNVALGERRANSVADLLRSKGVNDNQLRVVSYGAQRLAVPGHSEEDYQQDRRVVLTYTQR